jgi:hypothetical protein
LPANTGAAGAQPSRRLVRQQGWLLQVEVSRELFGALKAMCFFRPTHRRTVGFERCHSFSAQTIVLAKKI